MFDALAQELVDLTGRYPNEDDLAHARRLFARVLDTPGGAKIETIHAFCQSLLQRFPLDTIKIDQSFVRAGNKGKRPVILRSIIGLAHDLGMDVVAEGAETDSDGAELFQLGCEYAQGYAFGEPMTVDRAQRLLMEGQVEAAS